QYSVVPIIRDAVASAEDARSYAGATEMLHVEFYTMLVQAMPTTVDLEEYVVNRTTLFANATPGTGPLSRPDIGEVLVTGYSDNPVNAAEMTERLEALAGIEHVRVLVTVRE